MCRCDDYVPIGIKAANWTERIRWEWLLLQICVRACVMWEFNKIQWVFSRCCVCVCVCEFGLWFVVEQHCFASSHRCRSRRPTEIIVTIFFFYLPLKNQKKKKNILFYSDSKFFLVMSETFMWLFFLLNINSHYIRKHI